MKRNGVIAVVCVSLIISAGLLVWLVLYIYAKVATDLNDDNQSAEPL